MSAAAQSLSLAEQAEFRYWRRCQRARIDLATFVELCARDEDGRPIELAAIHKSWIWHVDYCWSRGKHAGILAPFGSGKTSAFAIPLAAFLIGQSVQERLKYVCNGDDFAKLRLASVKRIVESAVYRDVFPEVRPWSPWGEKAITVRRQGFAADPTVQARGVETMGVGLRADHIIFDDICDQANTEEEGRRKRVKALARGTWMSRLDTKGAERPGLAAMIATAWHPDDATHDFMNDPNWCFLVQRVSPDLLEYEQEVLGAGEDYLEGHPSVLGGG